VPSSTAGARSAAGAAIKRATDAGTVALSADGQHVAVEGATHQGLALGPEHARSTSAAIRRVVEAARTGQPLVPQGRRRSPARRPMAGRRPMRNDSMPPPHTPHMTCAPRPHRVALVAVAAPAVLGATSAEASASGSPEIPVSGVVATVIDLVLPSDAVPLRPGAGSPTVPAHQGVGAAGGG
jgi:hypothetical protein